MKTNGLWPAKHRLGSDSRFYFCIWYKPLKNRLFSLISAFLYAWSWSTYSLVLQRKRIWHKKNRQFSSFLALGLIMIGQKKKKRNKRKDTSLLKTDTFVLFQHFYMHMHDYEALILWRFKEKKCGLTNRHFPAFSALIMIGMIEKSKCLLKTSTYVLFSIFMCMLLWSAYFSALQRKKCGIKKPGTFLHFRH